MADLIFRIKADYEEAEKCREELKKVEAQLKAVDQNTSPKEIERLTKEYVRLSTQWENCMSRAAKTGVSLKNAYQSIGNFIKGYLKNIDDSSKKEQTLVGDLKNKLSVNEAITEELRKQKESAEDVRNKMEEKYKASLEQEKRISDFYEKKFGGDVDAAANDPKAVETIKKAQAVTERWRRELDGAKRNVEATDTLLEKAEKKTDAIRKEYERITTVDVGDNATLKSLQDQADAAKDNVEQLTKELDELKGKKIDIELNIKRDEQNISDIESKTNIERDAADIERIDVSEKINSLNGELDTLHGNLGNLLREYTELQGVQSDYSAKVDELKDKVRQHGAEEYNLSQQLLSMKRGTEEFVQTQQQIDFHHREWEKYTEQLNNAQEKLSETKTKMSDLKQQLDQNRSKLSEKETEKSDLLEHYDELTKIIESDNSENEALKAAIDKRDKDNALLEQQNQKIQETSEKLQQSIDLSNQLKDMVDEYGKVYEGFVKTETDHQATRVFTKEEDYNRSQELHGQASDIEKQLESGVLSEADIRDKQAELHDIQEELAVLDEQAIRTGESLGAKLGAQAQQMTENLFNANKKVKELSTEILDTDDKLTKLQKTLGELQDGKTEEELKKNQDEINKTNGEIIALTEKIKDLREKLASATAEQKDAKEAINGTKGELRETLGELAEKKGVFGDIEEAVSHLPEPLQKTAMGIKGVGKAMSVLMKNPLMIFLSAIVLALQALWKWFQKTEEGQRAFAKISGYVSGVLSRLEDIVVAVGGAIFKFGKMAYQAFQNPQKAITDFAKLVRQKIWNLVSRTSEMFGAMGTLIKNVFTGNWDNLGKDLDNVKKKVRAAFDASPVGAMVNGVTNLVEKTGDWFSETHKVATESAKIKQDEQALGDEIEKNREKTIKLQKSMAELQATMRNTNLSKAERQKAMEEYKKAVEQQAKIQRDFAEKRRSIQERKMNLSSNETLEEQRELARLSNDVLQADVNMQRQLASLQRLDNSINKKNKGNGKTKEQLAEEYNNLMDEQAQKQAKQIRENGYIIAQAQINALQDGNEKTIAQMKLDYQKELDAATEYENELMRQKIKLARDAFRKDPKNKKKAFDVTAVDLSMTEQERQVSVSKVSDAKEKYRQQIESLMKPYETYAEKREKKERDYKALTDFVASEQADRYQKLGNLYEKLSTQEGEEVKITEQQIKELEKEISQLEEKGRIIKLNRDLQDEELQAMREYIKQYGTIQQRQDAIRDDYKNKITKAEAEGDVIGAARLRREQEKSESDLKLEEIKAKIDWESVFSDLNLYSKEYLVGLRQTLSDMMKDPALTPENAQIIGDKLGAIDKIVNEKASNTFNWINSYLVEQKRLSTEAKLAQDAYNNALNEEIVAKESLSNEQLDIAALYKEFSGGNEIKLEQITSSNQDKIFKDLGISIDDTSEKAELLRQAFKRLTGAEAEAAAKSGKTEKLKTKAAIAEAKTDKDKPLKDKIASVFSAINDDVQKYLGDLPGLLDELGLGEVGDKASKGLSAFNNAAGAAADFASGNYVGAALKAVSAVKDVIGIFGSSNAEEMLAIQEEQMDKIEANTYAIEKMTEALEKSYGSEAIKNAQEVEKRLEDNMLSIVKGIDATLSSDYGNRHSDYYHLNKNQTLLAQLQQYGKEFGINIWESSQGKYTWQQLLNNNSKDLAQLFEKVKMDDAELWRLITKESGANNGKLEEWLEKLIETYDKIGENEELLSEQLLNTTADSMFSDFMNSLNDLANGSTTVFQDVADGWQEMVNSMTLNNIVASEYQDKIKDWYSRMSEEMKGLTSKNVNKSSKEYKTQLQALTKKYGDEYQELLKEGAEDVKNLRDMGLISTPNAKQQSATANSIQNISYDQAESLVGIGLNHTILMEQTKQEVSLLNAKVDQLFGGAMPIRDIAADSRDILAGMAIDLSTIKDGVVDDIIPRIKTIESETIKVRKAVEAQ